MNSIELLERICKLLQETATPEWENVELVSKEKTIGYFESKIQSEDAFVGSEKHRYPKESRVWGIEIFIDDKCVFQEYDIIGKDETNSDAQERISQRAIINLCIETINEKIKLVKQGFKTW